MEDYIKEILNLVRIMNELELNKLIAILTAGILLYLIKKLPEIIQAMRSK